MVQFDDIQPECQKRMPVFDQYFSQTFVCLNDCLYLLHMKQTKNYLLGFLIIGTISMAATCKKGGNTATDKCKTVPTYSSNVKPIIDEACGNRCHSTKYKAAGIELTSYELVSAASKKGNFMGSLRHLAGYAAMPKKADKFSDSVLNILQCWVDNGSPQ